jgi:hypothetical protein
MTTSEKRGPPHLFPHELTETKYTRFVESQAEQAKEQDEKQGNVGDEHGD